jgi:hypothetical protein
MKITATEHARGKHAVWDEIHAMIFVRDFAALGTPLSGS